MLNDKLLLVVMGGLKGNLSYEFKLKSITIFYIWFVVNEVLLIYKRAKWNVIERKWVSIDDTQKINRLNAPDFNGLEVTWKAWKKEAQDQRWSGWTDQEPSDD